jgi:hypothetical protein
VIHPKFDVSPILAKLVVFSPNDLFDDRLCDLIPMLRLAAVANADRDFGTTKDIALVGPLYVRYSRNCSKRGGRGQLSGLRDRRPIERVVNKGFVERHTLNSQQEEYVLTAIGKKVLDNK